MTGSGVRRSDAQTPKRGREAGVSGFGWSRYAPALSRCAGGMLFALLLAGPAYSQSAEALLAKHEALAVRLASNQYNRLLYVESEQNYGDSKGEVFGVIEQSFDVAKPSLQVMDHWCDILILHPNMENCQHSKAGAASALKLNIGASYATPLEETFSVEFNYKVVAASADYLRVELRAEKGPMSTTDFQIMLEAVALNAQQTFFHLSYSYRTGIAGRIAMFAYFATIGRNKVGFTVVGTTAKEEPVYIKGARGLIERNTMRYYLAIEAYLVSVKLPPAEALEKRLQLFFDAMEAYPVQLHELQREQYLYIKHREVKLLQPAG